MNNAAVNIHMQLFMDLCLIPLGYIPSSNTAKSYGNSMFNTLINRETLSQSGCIILYYYQRSRKVSILFNDFLTTHFLTIYSFLVVALRLIKCITVYTLS